MEQTFEPSKTQQTSRQVCCLCCLSRITRRDSIGSIHIGLCTPKVHIIFHIFAMATILTAYIWSGITFDDHIKVGWIMIYLTLWNVFLQTLFWMYSIFVDFMIIRDLKVSRHDALELGNMMRSHHNHISINYTMNPSQDSYDLYTSNEPLVSVLATSDSHTTSNEENEEVSIQTHSQNCITCCSSSGNCHSDVSFRQFCNRRLSTRVTQFVLIRDRWFPIVLSIGTFVAFGYWILLFPSTASKLVSAGEEGSFIQNIFNHGLTSIFAWTEALIVRHRTAKQPLWSVVLCTLFITVYLGWNMLMHHINGKWVYPSVQDKIKMPWAIPVYIILVCIPGVLYILWSLVLNRYWRLLERRAHSYKLLPLE